MRSFPESSNVSKTGNEKVESEKINEENTTIDTSVSSKSRRSLINRTNIYKTIERKLNALVCGKFALKSSSTYLFSISFLVRVIMVMIAYYVPSVRLLKYRWDYIMAFSVI